MQDLVQKAIEFATKSHNGQFRKWSEGKPEPHINHPLRVMEHCKQFTTDQDTLAAAVLHDTVEDCPDVTLKQIIDLFGVNVALLVWELTNPSRNFPSLRRKERKKMDRDHIAEASAEAQMIKACDRIDNLRSIKTAPQDFIDLYRHESSLLADVLNHIPASLREEFINTIG